MSDIIEGGADVLNPGKRRGRFDARNQTQKGGGGKVLLLGKLKRREGSNSTGNTKYGFWLFGGGVTCLKCEAGRKRLFEKEEKKWCHRLRANRGM